MHVSVLSRERISTTIQHYNAFQCFIMTAGKTHRHKADLILKYDMTDSNRGFIYLGQCMRIARESITNLELIYSANLTCRDISTTRRCTGCHNAT